MGLFFTEESSYTSIMHRDQTDEWRGWMMMVSLMCQCVITVIITDNQVILVYHYTGASVSVPIYMHIRLCISMHLFLLGYEHFVYSWHKGRTGITRLVQVKMITSVKLKFL